MRQFIAGLMYTLIIGIMLTLGILTTMGIQLNPNDSIYLGLSVGLWICIVAILYLLDQNIWRAFVGKE